MFEASNEILLFQQNKASLKGRDFVDIGCATGELYRYMNRYQRDFHYRGFDVSAPAIRRAKEKYPKGSFFVCDEDLASVAKESPSPAVVFARDVVHHQPDPFAFVAKLLAITGEVALLRFPTRDHGETLLDPEMSCQWHFGHWVPYIVPNVDDLVERITGSANVKKLFIYKHYQQLGGLNNRFLQKELYIPETGTALSAVYVELADEPVPDPQIVVRDHREPTPRPTFRGLLSRGLRRARRSMRR